MSVPASPAEREVTPPWWVQLCRVLWKLCALVWGAIVLALTVSVLATWLTTPAGPFPPPTSPLAWLENNWLVPLLVGVCLLLLTATMGILSRWPIQATASDLNRTHMLRRLRRSYEKQLAESLDGVVWLDLGLVQKPDAVKNTVLRLRRTGRAELLLPSGTPILQVYEEAAEELLILGEPGAGKSSLLLQLAAQLAERAEREEAQPVPVILPLASWAVSRPPLKEWLAEQMAQVYDVPESVAGAWVQNNQLLPLLDGLDEMEDVAYPACVEAINAYHHAHPMPLVVCSRMSEYMEAAKQHRLTLQGAVVIQPLDPAQVEATLAQVGEPLAGLKRALKMNPALRDLATTPLMLSVLMLTYRGKSVRLVSRQAAELEQQVWTDYVRQVVESKGNPTRYPLEHTQAWLHWLAQQLRDHNQAVFYLEYLQPNWLPTGSQRAYTWLAIRLPGILFGVLAGFALPLFLYGNYDPVCLLQYGVLGGFLGGLFSAWGRGGAGSQTLPSHPPRTPFRRFIQHATMSILVGLGYGLAFGFDLGHFGPTFYGGVPYTLGDWPWEGGILGGCIAIGCWILLAMMPRFSDRQVFTPPTNSAQRWLNLRWILRTVNAQRVLLVATVLGLSIRLSDELLQVLSNVGLPFEPAVDLGFVLEYALLFGLIGVLLSLTLEGQPGAIHLTERMRWTWGSLIRSLCAPRHLRTTVVLASSVLVLVGLSQGLVFGSSGLGDGLSYGLSYGLSAGLSVGLSYWLLLGLFQGIAPEQVEDQERRAFNQGIRRSFRNSAMMGLLSGVVIGVIGIISFGLSVGLRDKLTTAALPHHSY